MILSIIIPCYNEAESIPLLVEKCNSILEDKSIEIVLVNNGSTDKSKEILKTYNSSFTIVDIKKNIGYGNGILEGLKKAKGTILAWTHADLQTDPQDVLKAFNLNKQKLLDKKLVIKGRRKNRNIFDSLFTFLMSIYVYFKLKKVLIDINAQPKIFHSDFLNDFKNPPLDFSLDLFVLHYFKTNNIPIINYPVYFSKRNYGEAKGGGTFKGKLKLIKRTLNYINELSKKI